MEDDDIYYEEEDRAFEDSLIQLRNLSSEERKAKMNEFLTELKRRFGD